MDTLRSYGNVVQSYGSVMLAQIGLIEKPVFTDTELEQANVINAIRTKVKKVALVAAGALPFVAAALIYSRTQGNQPDPVPTPLPPLPPLPDPITPEIPITPSEYKDYGYVLAAMAMLGTVTVMKSKNIRNKLKSTALVVTYPFVATASLISGRSKKLTPEEEEHEAFYSHLPPENAPRTAQSRPTSTSSAMTTEAREPQVSATESHPTSTSSAMTEEETAQYDALIAKSTKLTQDEENVFGPLYAKKIQMHQADTQLGFTKSGSAEAALESLRHLPVTTTPSTSSTTTQPLESSAEVPLEPLRLPQSAIVSAVAVDDIPSNEACIYTYDHLNQNGVDHKYETISPKDLYDLLHDLLKLPDASSGNHSTILARHLFGNESLVNDLADGTKCCVNIWGGIKTVIVNGGWNAGGREFNIPSATPL